MLFLVPIYLYLSIISVLYLYPGCQGNELMAAEVRFHPGSKAHYLSCNMIHSNSSISNYLMTKYFNRWLFHHDTYFIDCCRNVTIGMSSQHFECFHIELHVLHTDTAFVTSVHWITILKANSRLADPDPQWAVAPGIKNKLMLMLICLLVTERDASIQLVGSALYGLYCHEIVLMDKSDY